MQSLFLQTPGCTSCRASWGFVAWCGGSLPVFHCKIPAISVRLAFRIDNASRGSLVFGRLWQIRTPCLQPIYYSHRRLRLAVQVHFPADFWFALPFMCFLSFSFCTSFCYFRFFFQLAPRIVVSLQSHSLDLRKILFCRSRMSLLVSNRACFAKVSTAFCRICGDCGIAGGK